MAVTILDYIGEGKRCPEGHLKHAVRYILNPEKTEQGLWTGGNVGRDADGVLEAMLDTKRDWQKLSGRQGYHFKISFKPGETDEKTAFCLVRDFCEQYLGENYDYCFSIHNDKPHMHGHIIFNSVNRISGYKYRYVEGDWERTIQPVTDALCRKYGLSELVYEQGERKGRSYAEHLAGKEGRMTNTMIIRADMDEAIRQAEDFPGFLKVMREMGYQIRFGVSEKRGSEYMSLLTPGAVRARRDYKLGEGYRIEDIKRRLLSEKRKENASSMEYPLPAGTPKGKLQVCALERIRQAYGYREYDRQLIDQKRVRRDLLQIDRLREECIFLMANHLESVSAVHRELEQAKLEIREMYHRQEAAEAVEQSLGLAEQEARVEYRKLKKKIRDPDTPDREYEEASDRLSILRREYPLPLLESGEKKEMERLQQLKARRNLLRRILKDAEETLKVTPLQRIPSGARLRKVPGKEKLTYGKEQHG